MRCQRDVDYIFLLVGQRALAAEIATYSKAMSPNTKVIGVQPDGADSVIQAFQAKQVVKQEILRDLKYKYDDLTTIKSPNCS
ncbi:unnamed protein product [Paramecium octaurelia]|uniref:Tryptophan synthase beta chain-like PALP domain-containing protein n=1 Tax=Paramecium octaurelia TaxID=43137 RepID=A0A8S1YC27_PAROT|nr:unnamed protein product [Paramecium octaurelia]